MLIYICRINSHTTLILKPTLIFKFTFLTIVNSTTPLDVLTNNGLSEVLSHLAFH
jgi:hypothetical protein